MRGSSSSATNCAACRSRASPAQGPLPVPVYGAGRNHGRRRAERRGGRVLVATPIAAWAGQSALLAPYAQGLGLAIAVALITYLSVVLGELVPKRLALLAPEKVALVIAGR